jgi:hypothetical protein
MVDIRYSGPPRRATAADAVYGAGISDSVAVVAAAVVAGHYDAGGYRNP